MNCSLKRPLTVQQFASKLIDTIDINRPHVGLQPRIGIGLVLQMLINRAVIDLSFIMHKRSTVAVSRNTELRGQDETITCLGLTHRAADAVLYMQIPAITTKRCFQAIAAD